MSVHSATKSRHFVEVDGTLIKVEFLVEGCIEISGALDPDLSVPVLSREDRYTEKLLAKTDRGMDRSQMSRYLIDLAMMIKAGDRYRQSL